MSPNQHAERIREFGFELSGQDGKFVLHRTAASDTENAEWADRPVRSVMRAAEAAQSFAMLATLRQDSPDEPWGPDRPSWRTGFPFGIADAITMAEFAVFDPETGKVPVPPHPMTLWRPVMPRHRQRPNFRLRLEAENQLWASRPIGSLSDAALLVCAIRTLTEMQRHDADEDDSTWDQIDPHVSLPWFYQFVFEDAAEVDVPTAVQQEIPSHKTCEFFYDIEDHGEASEFLWPAVRHMSLEEARDAITDAARDGILGQPAGVTICHLAALDDLGRDLQSVTFALFGRDQTDLDELEHIRRIQRAQLNIGGTRGQWHLRCGLGSGRPETVRRSLNQTLEHVKFDTVEAAAEAALHIHAEGLA